MIRALLEKLFDIREGELFRALSMQFNIFLIITTLLILKPTVNSLFLSAYGIQSLPNAYIFVAITAGIITTLYSKIVHHVRFIYLNTATLFSSVLILLFFGFALRTGIWSSTILYLFYIWVAIFAVLTTSQFWLLVNMVFNVREIKRLVGFIGSGAIAGGIFGGYLTSYLIRHMSSINLPFVGAFTIALCIPLSVLIYRRSKNVATSATVEKQRSKNNKAHPLKIIFQSKHLTLLAAIVAVSNVVAKLVDYQFSDMASSLITDPEKLTAFFGFWFSTFNVAAFAIQLLATRYLLNRFGVGLSLLLLPLAILFAAICLIIAPELLLAVILMKMADGSFKQSINKSAMELLILPISIETKNQTKTFIDVFVDSLAAGFSGLLLIFVVKGLSLSSTTISLLILGFAGAWIFLVTKVRKEYLYSFKMKIIKNVTSKKQQVKQVGRKALVNDIVEALTNGKQSQILSALQQIKPLKDKRYQKVVCELLSHPNADVRAEALQYLSHYKDKKVYRHVETMTADPSTKVKRATFAYLIEHTPFREKNIIAQQLDSSSGMLSGLALISLASSIQNNPKLKRKYNLEQRIKNKIKSIPNIQDPKQKYLNKIYCIQAIGHANIQQLYPLLRNFFKDEKAVVVRQALLAAGRTQSDFFVKDLIHFTSQKKFSRMAHKALELYGSQMISILRSHLKKYATDLPLIRRYPSIVKQVGTQKAVLFLFRLLQHDDLIVRQKALEGLSDIHRNYPLLHFKKKKIILQVLEEVLRLQHSLSLFHVQIENVKKDEQDVVQPRKRVCELLRKRIQTQVDNILFLLTLRYSRENIPVIQKGLKSSKIQMRITALEFLDNLLPSRLKKILIPLFEVAVVDIAKRQNIDKLDLAFPNEYESLQLILVNSKNIRLKIATLHLIRKLKNQEHLPLVKECIRLNDPELKLFAQNVLADMEMEGSMQLLRS